MSRLAPFLVLIISIAGFEGTGKAFAAAPSAPSAQVISLREEDPETAKYNRKLFKLEEKRVKAREKLEADYRKLFWRKDSIDPQKLQKKLEEFRLKRDKLEEKYRKDLLKIERDWQKKHEKADN